MAAKTCRARPGRTLSPAMWGSSWKTTFAPVMCPERSMPAITSNGVVENPRCRDDIEGREDIGDHLVALVDAMAGGEPSTAELFGAGIDHGHD